MSWKLILNVQEGRGYQWLLLKRLIWSLVNLMHGLELHHILYKEEYS